MAGFSIRSDSVNVSIEVVHKHWDYISVLHDNLDIPHLSDHLIP